MQCEEYFYAYIYYDPLRNNIPIYVGKGSNERAWTHLSKTKINIKFRNRLRTLRKNNVNPQIGFYSDIDEEFALFLEEELISKFGRRDLGTGTLYNLTTGGDGARCGIETCKKISASLKGRHLSEAHKLNISNSKRGRPGKPGENNPFFGKTHTTEALSKISKSSKERVYSDESRKKMSESAKSRWQKR